MHTGATTRPTANEITGTLRNLDSVRLDLDRAHADPGPTLTLTLDADRPTALHLTDIWSDPLQLHIDGVPADGAVARRGGLVEIELDVGRHRYELG